MAIDLSKVIVSRKEALAIMEQVRPRLVAQLKDGVSREVANRNVAAWLREQNNILSPYADEVVSRLLVSDDEVEWRNAFGDDFCDAYVKVMNSLKYENKNR